MGQVKVLAGLGLAFCCAFVVALGGSAQAPASAGSASAAQANDPRLAQLSPQDRQSALNEIPGSKTYCATNAVLPQVFDCDCFAQMVFDYRMTHSNLRGKPTIADMQAGRPAPPEPLVNIIPALDCSKCISEERITKWVTADVAKSFSPAEGWSDAQVKTITACTSRKVIDDLRAKPTLGNNLARERLGPAEIACQTAATSTAATSAPAQTATAPNAASQAPKPSVSSQAPANAAPQAQATPPASPAKPALSPAATRMSELHQRYTTDSIRLGKDEAAMRQILRTRYNNQIPDGFMKAEKQCKLDEKPATGAMSQGNYDQSEKDLQDMEASLATMETFLSK